MRRAMATAAGPMLWPEVHGMASSPRAARVSEARRAGPDVRALERDLEALHPRCFGWALACCGWNAEEAADVLQAAYLKILDGSARFEHRSQLSTFVYGVVRRTAAARRRRRLRSRLLLARHLAPERDPAAAAASARLPGELRRLRAALAALPGRQREVLHLVFYAELSIREAAEVMGVSLGSARVHYQRGKQRLRELLGRDEREGPAR